jgi:hypothetical protein
MPFAEFCWRFFGIGNALFCAVYSNIKCGCILDLFGCGGFHSEAVPKRWHNDIRLLSRCNQIRILVNVHPQSAGDFFLNG